MAIRSSRRLSFRAEEATLRLGLGRNIFDILQSVREFHLDMCLEAAHSLIQEVVRDLGTPTEGSGPIR